MLVDGDTRVLAVTGRHSAQLLLAVLAACSNHVDTERAPVTRAAAEPVARPDPIVARAAELTLRAWLDASREGSRTASALDTLGACDDGGGSYFPTTLLANYVILPFESRGDTIVGRAEVVTVAEQDIDRRATNRFVARQRIRQDVLEWDLIPVDAHHWVVCNGLRFGYRGADSLTTWRPDSTSYATARALVDSIVAARPE